MKNAIRFCGWVAAAVALAGCNVGMAPKGSEEETRREFQAMPLEKQIDIINRSPAPPAEKERMIREAKQRAGVAEDSPTPGASGPIDPTGRGQ